MFRGVIRPKTLGFSKHFAPGGRERKAIIGLVDLSFYRYEPQTLHRVLAGYT